MSQNESRRVNLTHKAVIAVYRVILLHKERYGLQVSQEMRPESQISENESCRVRVSHFCILQKK